MMLPMKRLSAAVKNGWNKFVRRSLEWSFLVGLQYRIAVCIALFYLLIKIRSSKSNAADEQGWQGLPTICSDPDLSVQDIEESSYTRCMLRYNKLNQWTI